MSLSARSFAVVAMAAAVLCLTAPTAEAGPSNISAGEIARLPEYCPDTQTFEKVGNSNVPNERQKRWVEMMGATFWAMHHYCWALVSSHRADRVGTTPQVRLALMESAIDDSNYVLNNSFPDFPLRPEVLLRMGQFAMRADNPVQALEYFEASRKAKADYWPAYIGLHEVNLRIGRRQAAVDILRQGLQVMPDEPKLKAALAKLQPTTERSAGR